MQVDRKLGFLLLGIWLIATGAMSIFGLHFNGQHYILGGLAIAAGAVILARR
jgi:hypothetical protein